MTRRLLLARHGQSEFNARNLFTGWSNPPLTPAGLAEADAIAARVVQLGGGLNAIYGSALLRTQQTIDVVRSRLPDAPAAVYDSALNERDYGDLAGLDKAEAAARWGATQVRRWRRSYAEAPPHGESLRDTAARVLPFYIQQILPSVMQGGATLVVAHGNSLRALVMALDGLTPDGVAELEIATGEMRLYALGPDTRVTEREVLAI